MEAFSGTRYTVCYCPRFHGDCDDDADYTHKAGVLTVRLARRVDSELLLNDVH